MCLPPDTTFGQHFQKVMDKKLKEIAKLKEQITDLTNHMKGYEAQGDLATATRLTEIILSKKKRIQVLETAYKPDTYLMPPPCHPLPQYR